MVKKIPATVITGFLGAGKTTLIRHLLRENNGMRIALIINEFGDLGVDGTILQGCGIENCAEDDVVELSNGCICCTVADDFIPAMKGLLERDNPPDHIIIETSGLALPQPLIQAFNWPEIRTHVSVDGVIALVDGLAWQKGQFSADPDALETQRKSDDRLEHTTPLEELFDDQMSAADLIVITKCDMLADAGGAVKSALAKKARTGTPIITIAHGQVDPKILLGLGLASESTIHERPPHHHERHHHEEHDGGDHDDEHDHDHAHEHDHAHDHDHDAFESFVLELPEIEDINAYMQKIADAAGAHGLLRVKGFGAVRTKPMRVVIQAVGTRGEHYFDTPFGDMPRQTRLVIIGFAGMDKDAITRALSP